MDAFPHMRLILRIVKFRQKAQDTHISRFVHVERLVPGGRNCLCIALALTTSWHLPLVVSFSEINCNIYHSINILDSYDLVPYMKVMYPDERIY